MRFLAATSLLVAALTGFSGLLSAGETDDPRQMLERMSSAMTQMTYQGTFVYVQGEEIETMRITHVSDERGVRERLTAISGAPREILRDSSGLRWVLAEDGSVFEDTGFNHSFFPELPVDQDGFSENSYSLEIGSGARIAGHETRNLRVNAGDKYRYSYSLWLEDHSDLLLKWELIDSDRKPIAMLMFTDVRFGSEVDVRELKPASQLKKFRTVESQLPTGRGFAGAPPRWQPELLPPGFRLTAHRYFGESDHGIFEHLVYSDGLAAVSVYIESIVPGNSPQTGLNRLGTTHAFSRTSGDMLITVVGDVPATTVKLIGDAVKIASH